VSLHQDKIPDETAYENSATMSSLLQTNDDQKYLKRYRRRQ